MARTLDDVLAEVAVPGTDPEAVSEYVNGALIARRRRSRLAGVAAVLLALVFGGTVLALTGSEEPDEVVSASSERDDSDQESDDSESSAAGSGSVVTAVPTTLAPVTTVPGIAGLTTLPLLVHSLHGRPVDLTGSPGGPGPGAHTCSFHRPLGRARSAAHRHPHVEPEASGWRYHDADLGVV